jgi:hypothetical protein
MDKMPLTIYLRQSVIKALGGAKGARNRVLVMIDEAVVDERD